MVPQRAGASELAAQLATLTAEGTLSLLSPLLQKNPRECTLRGRSVRSRLASSKGVGAAGSPGTGQRPSDDVGCLSWPGWDWKQV